MNGAGKQPSSRNGISASQLSRAGTQRKALVACDEDFEPDDLIPTYLDTMVKLFWLQRPKQATKKPIGNKNRPLPTNKEQLSSSKSDDLEEAKLLAKVDRIEQDILFDKPLAEHMWRNRRIDLEKEFASNMRKAEQEREQEREQEKEQDDSDDTSDSDDDIAKEAKRMAAEILQQEDSGEDQSLSDLFGSLPVLETDASGKTSTVINGSDGVKVTIRDFGKWTGVSPTRALEEACRSRYVVARGTVVHVLLTQSQRFDCENYIQHCIRELLFQSTLGVHQLVQAAGGNRHSGDSMH